jgi:ubiquinone/menaquinone biosynthesis C-methylase UbiE
MEEFHFVAEYVAHVAALQTRYPRDRAMRLAVGGDSDYDLIGDAQARALTALGLTNRMALVDLGCGSGRTAKHLALRFPQLRYTGIDIVEDLLGFAREQAPASFRFVLNRTLSLPLPSDSVDFVCAFSLFTHLLHEETYCYLEESRRVLAPGGRIVFSFLDLDENRPIFDDMVKRARQRESGPHLNMFIEPSTVRKWARWLDLGIEAIQPGAASQVGQSLAILRRPD